MQVLCRYQVTHKFQAGAMQGAGESATRRAGENAAQESMNLKDSLMGAANRVVMITTLDRPRV